MDRETRKYKLNINCSSCRNNIESAFKPYQDITWTLNIVTKILKVNFETNKYSDEFILKLVKSAGYNAEKL